MALQTVGQTTHFLVRYEDTLGAAALNVANAVFAVCEADLQKLSFYMPYQAGGAGDPFIQRKILVQIVAVPGGPGFASADNNGFFPGNLSRIRINPFAAPGVAISNDYAGFVFVAEMAEILMGFYGWDAGSSQGEALSRIMAEVLHPASTQDFVSTWLSIGRPRPDWISHNALSLLDSPFGRGDLNVIAYGCGIIFIYFLHSQLGFSFHEICTSGGTLLSDRYRRLTHATDDPSTRVGDLLDRHFGTGAITGVPNNPFPLYEGDARILELSFGKPTAKSQRLFNSGHAHIKPFFTCPAADYPYAEYGLSVARTITATAVGLGAPQFGWRVNGKKLVASSQTNVTVISPVNVPDPQNPGQPLAQTQDLTFDYKIDNSLASSGQSSLTLTSHSFGGDYQLQIQAEADESAVPTKPVTTQQSLTISTRQIVYGGTYAADRERCEAEFLKSLGKYLRPMQDSIDLLNKMHNLPDPPPDAFGRTLEAVAQIRDRLSGLTATKPEIATQIAHYAASKVGVPAHVFLQSARGDGLTNTTKKRA